MTKRVEIDLLEIINGYSKLTNDENETFYYRHLSLKESLSLETVYEERFNKAIKAGVLTEKQLLDNAIKYGQWGTTNEENVKALKWEIGKLREASKKISDNVQKISAENTLKRKMEELKEEENIRESICSMSAEKLGEFEKIKYILNKRCFKDPDLKERINKPTNSTELSGLLERMNDEQHLLKIAYCQSFFDIYMIYRKQPYKLFDNRGFDTTIYQKNILILAGTLLNKLQNFGDDMDANKKNDPLYIYKFEPKQDKGQGGPQSVSDHTDLAIKARKGKNLTPEDLLA